MINNKYLFVLLFSAAIVYSVNCQDNFDNSEDEQFENEETMPLSRHERDLSVAETAGIGGGAGGAAGK